MIRVLIVDDHPIISAGVQALVGDQPDLEVTGCAPDGETALEMARLDPPDVVVMDLSMPGVSGLETIRRIIGRQAAARILVFSMHEDVIFVRRALQAGAFGYVTKASAPNVLVYAIHSIAAGKKYISPEIAQVLALSDFGGERDAADGLSAREFEVLRLLAQGQSIKDIAESLGLNPKTVANHQSTIKQKLGADSAIQLLKKANQLGLESPG